MSQRYCMIAGSDCNTAAIHYRAACSNTGKFRVFRHMDFKITSIYNSLNIFRRRVCLGIAAYNIQLITQIFMDLLIIIIYKVKSRCFQLR